MQTAHNKLNVAILGTGNIGTDLLIKTLRSSHLQCRLFAGRSLSSAGMLKASALGVPISSQGIDAIERCPDVCDLVFDCTSAMAHLQHAPLLKRLGKTVIDLTPSKSGRMCVPAINLDDCMSSPTVNMITCGGQASIPMAHVIGKLHRNVEYIEVVSSIASRSAGPATRANIDEYIENTEAGLTEFSGAARTKAILILNPATPCIDMQTTIFAKVGDPNISELGTAAAAMERRIQSYVPGYKIVVPPVLEDGRIVIMVRVTGLGDYLPSFAGNLDIINCAAIAAAEGYARRRHAQAHVETQEPHHG